MVFVIGPLDPAAPALLSSFQLQRDTWVVLNGSYCDFYLKICLLQERSNSLGIPPGYHQGFNDQCGTCFTFSLWQLLL